MWARLPAFAAVPCGGSLAQWRRADPDRQPPIMRGVPHATSGRHTAGLLAVGSAPAERMARAVATQRR